MKVIGITRNPNQDAVEMLEAAIDQVKAGELVAVSISWVNRKGSIGGDCSEGKSRTLMWASLEHSARSFYQQHIIGAKP